MRLRGREIAGIDIMREHHENWRTIDGSHSQKQCWTEVDAEDHELFEQSEHIIQHWLQTDVTWKFPPTTMTGSASSRMPQNMVHTAINLPMNVWGYMSPYPHDLPSKCFQDRPSAMWSLNADSLQRMHYPSIAKNKKRLLLVLLGSNNSRKKKQKRLLLGWTNSRESKPRPVVLSIRTR